MHTQEITYQDKSTQFKGYMACPSATSKKLPAVLISHAWDGRSEPFCEEARRMAELGYVGVAIDNYGEGKVGKSREENQSMMMPLMENRQLLRDRLIAALEAVKKLDQVDPGRVAILGYCFGGLCALDLARSGADIKGALSFHGLLQGADNLPNGAIKAKILVMHGHDDPMVPPAQVQKFEEEMTAAKADWQLHVYGATMHAFTNPAANDPSFGTVYNEAAAKRSRRSALDFLSDIFA